MPNKNNPFIFLLGILFCISILILMVHYKHQVKIIALKAGNKLNHMLPRKPEPIRYNSIAQASPVIFFSDLKAGPNTGGQNNNGVFVTIWGNNFGATQGYSYITVGGGQVNYYPTWTNSMICFQLGPNTATGNITLVTPHGTTTGPSFAIQDGNIYFVQPGGDNNGSGTFESPFNHLASFESVANPGDTVYVLRGTISDEIDGKADWHSLMAPTVAGTPRSPISWIAYPNAKVILHIDGGAQSWPPDGSDNVNFIFKGYSPWQTVSKFTMVLTGSGVGSAIDSTGSDGWRVVGNNITASDYSYAIIALAGNDSSVLGNEIHHSGNNTFKNMNHSIYWDGGGQDVEIGWNYLHDNQNTGWEISCFHQGTRLGSIHDNLISNTNGNTLKGILLGDVDSGEDKSTVEDQNILLYNNILYNLGYNENGGAIQAVSGTAHIYNNTIYQSPESKGTIQFPPGGVGPGGGHPIWYVANNIIYNSLPNALYMSDGNGNDPNWSNFALLSNNNYYGAGNGPLKDSKAINADPQFDNTTFLLKPTSPDINAGFDTTSIVSNDFSGQIRSSTPTIGAYEYTNNSSTINNTINAFTASSLDRIFQDGKTLLKPSFNSTGSLSLAKNEYGSIQIVVQSTGVHINNVELKVTDLLNAKTGTKIDHENISVRVVGYVPTIKPYYPVKYVGNWPDPLLPKHQVNIDAGKTQPFWLTIYSPTDTDAGDYEGKVIIFVDHHKVKTIPLNVHIFNFELPKTSHLKTAFDYFDQYTALRYPKTDNESLEDYKSRINNLNDKYMMEMLKYRMNPILNVDPSSSKELTKIDRYLSLGLNNFAIGQRGGSFKNNWPSDNASINQLSSLYRTYGEDLQLNHMLAYSYIYLWDEGDMGNPQVSKIAAMIHHAYPDFKNMVDYHGVWDTALGADWIKDIDIWTFNIDDFNEQKIRQLQSMGKEIWMYISGPSSNETPNLSIDFDSIDYRIIPWLCWKYDIKGFLYWSVNYWAFVDPFTSAHNTKWDQNGNGLLFYPGDQGPIESIRMEIFRDGMEDYEYIQLLFEDLKLLKAGGLDKKYEEYFNESIKLLTMDDTIAASMSQFTKDGASLISRRNAIGRQIEEFNSVIQNSLN